MNVFEIPAHPAADVFPMLSDDELGELASDIAENGLREPIVLQKLDGETVLIDGRNRRAACAMANVEPTARWLDSGDPTAFVWSANGARRHLSAGQRAMAYATLYPHGEKGGRGNKRAPIDAGLHRNAISRARAVLKHEPLATQVMSGGLSLNAAYEAVMARRGADERQRAKIEEAELIMRHGISELIEAVRDLRLSRSDAAVVATRSKLVQRDVLAYLLENPVRYGWDGSRLHAYPLDSPTRWNGCPVDRFQRA